MELHLKKKKKLRLYVPWINDGSRLVFDSDQHPEVYLAGNYYSFALICKEYRFFMDILSSDVKGIDMISTLSILVGIERYRHLSDGIDKVLIPSWW